MRFTVYSSQSNERLVLGTVLVELAEAERVQQDLVRVLAHARARR